MQPHWDSWVYTLAMFTLRVSVDASIDAFGSVQNPIEYIDTSVDADVVAWCE